MRKIENGLIRITIGGIYEIAFQAKYLSTTVIVQMKPAAIISERSSVSMARKMQMQTDTIWNMLCAKSDFSNGYL